MRWEKPRKACQSGAVLTEIPRLRDAEVPRANGTVSLRERSEGSTVPLGSVAAPRVEAGESQRAALNWLSMAALGSQVCSGSREPLKKMG